MNENAGASKSGSTAMGYVLSPLPSGPHSAENTLEMTRLELAPADNIGPFTHAGAAIYFVESGSISAVFSDAANAVIRAMTGDPDVSPSSFPCTEGCTEDFQVGHWFSIDSQCSIALTSTGEGPAVVFVSSLTLDGGAVTVRTKSSEEITVIKDGRQPL